MGEIPFRGVWERFEEVAGRAPDRPVLVEGGAELTYGQLRAGAESLAALLLSRLGPGRHHVAVRARTAANLLTTSLAATRAGLVSVCLDMRDPAERLRSVCADAQVALVVTDSPGVPEDLDVVFLGAEPLPPAVPEEPACPRPGDLSCIAYSSGSTGAPKGVMWAERTRVGLAGRISDRLPPAARVGVPFLGSAGNTDAHVLLCLMGGAMLPYPVGELGLNGLSGWLRRHDVDVFATVPTMVRHLLASLPDDDVLAVKHVLLYGEGPAWSDITRLRRHLPAGAVVHNFYGAMEAAGGTYIGIGPDDPAGEGRAPAGWPSPGREVMLMGPDGRPVGPGESGEVTLAGEDMALGYWGKPELSAQKWEDLGDGRRRYWTGDLGRLDQSGCLEVIGRNDHMVKVNGFKVELQAIERALLDLPGVGAATAVAREDADGNLRVVAWATATGGHNEQSLRAELRRSLPGTMVPDRVVLVDEIPRLSNGKADRQELSHRPLPEVPALPGGDELTARVSLLFDQVLERHGTAPDDDFFDLGGDSLRAARLVVELERLTGVFLGPATMLESRTPAALAAVVAPHLSAGAGRPPSRLVPLRVTGSRPPLVVVHDGTAGVMYAGTIAQLLGDDHPVYAIEGQQVDGRPAVDRTVEDMARRYVSYLRAVLPDGPVALFGYSFGGLVAYEMGQQLRAQGRQVCFVGMGDTSAPNRPGAPVGYEKRTLPGMVRKARAWGVSGTTTRSVAKVRKYVAEKRYQRPFHQAERYFGSTEVVPMDLRNQFAMLDNGKVSTSYVPQALDGDLLLFRATGIRFANEDRWQELVGDGLHVIDVEAPHHDLMKPGGIEAVAGAMAEALARAAASTAQLAAAGQEPSSPATGDLAGVG